MRAAVYHGRADIRLESMPVPNPARGELLVEVAAVGICGTDATEYAHGPTTFPIEHVHPATGHCGPMVPGHEFSGFVAALGADVTGFAEGDLITSGAGISCGSCAQCIDGRTNLCDSYSTVGLQRNGALAGFTTVPGSCCVNIERRSLSSDVSAMAQPMSIAVHAMRRGRPEVDKDVLVLGAGGIGTFLIYAAIRAGLHVTAVDVDETRLRVVAGLGADTIQTSRAAPLVDQLSNRGLAPNVVYECTGVQTAVGAAVQLAARGGSVVVVGLQKAPVPVDLLGLALAEKELVGTLAHVFSCDFGHALDLLEDHHELWKQVAPTVLPLDELVSAGLEPMVRGGPTPIKTLLDPRATDRREIQTT